MLLVYTICTGMFGNGAAIAGMITTMAHQLTEVPGKLGEMITECCVEVRGTTMRSIAAVPIVTTTLWATGTGTGVFA